MSHFRFERLKLKVILLALNDVPVPGTDLECS